MCLRQIKNFWVNLSRRIYNKRNALYLAMFLGLLIIPAIFVGFTNKPIPGMPRSLTYFQKLFFLFPRRMSFWPTYYIEAQFKKDGPWIALKNEEYFRLQPFGYRDRTARFWELTWTYIDNPSDRLRAHAELANWIYKRYIQLYPSSSAPIALRFVQARYLPGRDNNPGHWQKPSLDFFAPSEISVLSTHLFAAQYRSVFFGK